MVRGVSATECKFLTAHKVLLDSDQLSFTVPSPADSVPVWSEAEGKGLVLMFVSTDPVPLGGHGETPWQVGASKIYFWLASSSRSSSSNALGSGFRPVGVRAPAGWGSGSGRRLGFVSGASGSRGNLA